MGLNPPNSGKRFTWADTPCVLKRISKNNKNKKSSINQYVTKKQVHDMLSTGKQKLVKFVDDLNNVDPSVGALTPVAQPGVAVGVNNMVGNRYNIKQIDFSFAFEANALATCTDSLCRLIIYQVTEPCLTAGQASPLTNQEILQDYSGAATHAAGTQTVNSPQTYATKEGKLIHFLKDEIFPLNPFNKSSLIKKFTLVPKIKNITYDAVNTLWERGTVYVWLINSRQNVNWGDTTIHNVKWSARTWFTDTD